MTDEEDRLAMAQVYDRVFSDADGRIVLEDLRRSYGDRRSFVEGDALATAFREGQRDVYLAIGDLLNVARDPARYLMVVSAVDEDAA
jgi:hypothetical protein